MSPPAAEPAAVDREFVALGSATGRLNPVGHHPTQGLYWTPAGARPKVAFIASHYNVDFSEHYLAPLLAARGFGFLGWNTRYRGAESWFLLEHALVDIAAGVRWLRDDAGVETVVLLGNSGGGSLMAAYQSQAVDPNITAVAGMSLPDEVLDPSDRELDRCYVGSPRSANRSPFVIGANCTLRTWLSMWSLRTSHCQGVPHLRRVAVPSLVVQGTADTGVFPSDARAIHEALASNDKELHLVPGDHYLEAPTTARDAVVELIADWTGARTT